MEPHRGAFRNVHSSSSQHHAQRATGPAPARHLPKKYGNKLHALIELCVPSACQAACKPLKGFSSPSNPSCTLSRGPLGLWRRGHGQNPVPRFALPGPPDFSMTESLHQTRKHCSASCRHGAVRIGPRRSAMIGLNRCATRSRNNALATGLSMHGSRRPDAAAFFPFLAGAAGARLVAADFFNADGFRSPGRPGRRLRSKPH